MERLPPYDLVDLRLLVALAEHRHFARAADSCGLSQPALSARIRRLETALAVPLIYRGKRFEGFTPDGDRALVWARRILSDCSGLVEDVRSAEGRPHGLLRLGVVPSATPYAGKLCGAVAARFPGVQTQILSLSSKAIGTALDEFELDAGITYGAGPASEGPDLAGNGHWQPLLEETYCLVARPDLTIPGNGAISWADAAKLPMCLLTPDMQNRRIIDEAFRDAGALPDIRLESNSFNAILAMVRAYPFATILPRLQVEAGLTGGLKVRDMGEQVTTRPIGLWIPKRVPERRVTGALLEVLSSLGTGDPLG
ncbi:LysR family transcriptional regulator [Roseibium aquae]|uniref:LysR family transcriptional regulator n=1 Tax=Roseibium aquae TaxID=1323746 RepID=A0A916TIC3_9HYPH|nr:LysR substrate-binding domain-containing protein [Roseibium aquae]GGB46444.1 LysR family transcriptional regulator [Roseibium aquae]